MKKIQWTTLDVVLHATRGVIKVPLKRAALLLGWEAGTMRNKKSEGTLPLKIFKEDGRIYVLAHVIAEYLDKPPPEPTIPKRGRPTKAEVAARGAP